MFQKESVLSEDILFDIAKYLFNKRNHKLKSSNLKSFVKNGVDFVVFYYITTRDFKIPKTVKINPLAKKSNNDWALELFCMEARELEIIINYNHFDINGPYYPRIIELILQTVCFQKINLPTILTKSNKLFKTIGIDIHKEKELYNGLYIIRLLHILTDHKVQLINKFDDSTDFEKVLLPIFKKYKIPFFLNSRSFEFDEIPYTILQYQIIFDKFEEKIKTLLGEETKKLTKIQQFLEDYDKPPIFSVLDTPEQDQERIFLNALNIICKDLGEKYYTLDNVIEEGFIPKMVMYLLHIDSIENVTDIESESIDVQIKNLEAVYNFIKKDNPSINNYLLDFQSDRSFSTRILLRFILDTYYLKSSLEELISRYYRLTEGIQKRVYPTGDQLTEIKNMIKIPYFIVNGTTDCNIDDYTEGTVFCTKHNIPLIMKFSLFKMCGVDEIFTYQLQYFYNMIDERKSLHVIEHLKGALFKLHKLKVPRISTIAASIKAKNVVFEQNDEQEQNDDDDESEEEENDDLPIKMNEHPTTIKDRFNEVLCVDQNQIETPEQYWNPQKLLNNAHYENGILISNKHKSDDAKSLGKWNDTIDEIKTNDNSKQNSIKLDIPNSESQAKYYKLFCYNEESKKWIFNDESEYQLKDDVIKKDEKIYFSNICYLESNEEDIILLNSKFINGKYPNLDNEKEIFVYAIIGSSFPDILEKVYPSEEEEEKRCKIIVPIFLIIHVPKEKRNHPNIKTIITQIYSLLSCVSFARIVILNKNNYETQIQNMHTIFDLIDKNIEEQRLIIEERDSYYGDEDEDDDEDTKPLDLSVLNVYNYNHQNRNHLSTSNIVFLINEKTIKNCNSEMDDKLQNSKLFTKINAKFDNKVIMKIININDCNTYKGFLDLFVSDLINAWRYIDFREEIIEDISFISARYISIKHDKKDQYSVIKSMIKKYYMSYHSLNVLFEYDKFSPRFDVGFIRDCKKVIIEMVSKIHIDRKILKDQLNQSATEHLEYINYQILKVIFPGLKQLEKLKTAHFSFLRKEYFDIIKSLAKEDLASILYDKYISILNKQIEKDNSRIKEIFSPCIKKIKKKDTPKEESFKDAKQKGTSYIMKETENVREIKVTLEMKDDLRSIIEQDF